MDTVGSIYSRWVRAALKAWVLILAFGACLAHADAIAPAVDNGIAQQVRELALAGTRHAASGAARVEIQVGQLDSRLRLAPCAHVEPYLPSGARLWGKTHVGLRCTQGTSAWNVFLPITVKIYGQGLVAAVPLAVGTVIASGDVTQAEVDLAEDASAAATDATLVVGRTVDRVMNTGQSVRLANLKPRQWFAAGDMVKVVTAGQGFSVESEAQAISAGMEGQVARVRTDSGRVLAGMPVGEHRMALSL